MSKHLRRSKARKNKVYQSIVWKCVEQLTNTGCFSKAQIADEVSIREPQMQGDGTYLVVDTGVTISPAELIGDGLRWDYIREFIEEDENVDLIPVAEKFFTRHAAGDERLNPEKYIATGHGKRTAGFALPCPENGHLAEEHYKRSLDRGQGAVDAVATKVTGADIQIPGVKQRVLGEPAPLALPAAPEITAEEALNGILDDD